MEDDWPGSSEYFERVRKELEERAKMKENEQLTPQQMSDLKDAFQLFDREGEGHINPQKLGKVMKKLGRNPTEAEVQDLIQAVDDDGNGQIEFDEFAAMMTKKMQEHTKDEEIREAFKVFDRNGNGYITPDEIGVLLGSLGVHFSADELRDMTLAADADGDHQIGFEDFLRTFKDDK